MNSEHLQTQGPTEFNDLTHPIIFIGQLTRFNSVLALLSIIVHSSHSTSTSDSRSRTNECDSFTMIDIRATTELNQSELANQSVAARHHDTPQRKGSTCHDTTHTTCDRDGVPRDDPHDARARSSARSTARWRRCGAVSLLAPCRGGGAVCVCVPRSETVSSGRRA